MSGQPQESPGRAAYHRVLLKLSGEALMGEDAYGINRQVLTRIAAEIKQICATGVQLALVVGGGNSSAGSRRPPLVWIGPPPITWACWPR